MIIKLYIPLAHLYFESEPCYIVQTDLELGALSARVQAYTTTPSSVLF